MAKLADAAGDSDFSPVDVPPEAKSIDAIIRFLIGELVRMEKLRQDQADQIISEILRRESLGSTSVGRGVAIPHARTDAIAKSIGVLGRCEPPVRWPGSLQQLPVHTVCLVVTPVDTSAPDALEMATRMLTRN